MDFFLFIEIHFFFFFFENPSILFTTKINNYYYLQNVKKNIYILNISFAYSRGGEIMGYKSHLAFWPFKITFTDL